MRSLWEFAGGHVVLQLCCWGQLFLTCAVPVSIELGDLTPCPPSLSVIKTVPGGCAFHAPSTQSWIHIFSWLRALRLTILVSREENRLFWSPIIGSLKQAWFSFVLGDFTVSRPSQSLRRQRERPKSNRLRLAKQQLCTWITLFCTFLCRHCTTATWKCLEREHKTTTFFFFPCTSIQSFGIQLQKKLPKFDEFNAMK